MFQPNPKSFFQILLLTFISIVTGHLTASGQNAYNLIWTKPANTVPMRVNSVAFNPAGDQVLSGTDCHPASLRIHDVSSGNLLWAQAVDSPFYCQMGVNFSSDGKLLASAEEMGHLFLFDASTIPPTPLDTIDLQTSYAFSVAFSPTSSPIREMAVGCSNGQVRFYSIDSAGAATFTDSLNIGSTWATALAYSDDGTRLATGANNGTVKLWDLATKTELATYSHANQITSVVFDQLPRKSIYSGSKDGRLKIFSQNNMAVVSDVQAHTGSLNGIATLGEGSKVKIATVGNDSLIVFRDTAGYNLGEIGSLETVDKLTSVATNIYFLYGTIVVGTEGGNLMAFELTLQSGLYDDLVKSRAPQLLVSPNPSRAGDRLTFSLTDGSTPLKKDSWELLNAFGARVASGPASLSNSFALPSTLSPGVYHLVLTPTNGGARLTTKVVVVE